MKRPPIIASLAAALIVSCSEGDEKKAFPAATQKSDIEMLREKVKNDPSDAEAWFHLADLYERAMVYEEEADALRKVIALEPGKAYAYFKLGTTYNRLRRYPEAVESFVRAEKYIKNQPMLYNNLAVSYGKIGKTREEIAALEKAIAIRPRYSVAHYNLGMALLRKGARQGAMKEYRILQDLDEGAAASLKKEIDAGERGAAPETPGSGPGRAERNAQCAECGMKVDVESRFVSRIVQGTETLAFCDIGDLLSYMNKKSAPPAAAQVRDERSGRWISAEKAFFVRSEKAFRTPMGWSIAAFEKKEEAAAFGAPMDVAGALRTVK